ncbi:MAG: hypothetical protein WBO55_13400 [Rhizobiaceae bacterium]
MPSGLENTPPVFGRPLWKDRFFWLMIGTALFWCAVIWYFFFA